MISMSSDCMPLPTPTEGQSEDDFVESCMINPTMKKEFPDKDQRLAVCFEQYRKKKGFVDSPPIPILRAFEDGGKKYVHGYAALFNVPDDFGTVMTKGCVESSEPRLRKFPAVRFMHRVPFGQILWDKEVNGSKTFIDNVGLHVLVGVYDSAEKEWDMVRHGGWGFSYGVLPKKIGKVCNLPTYLNKCFATFEEGIIYEVSVVDAPAHIDAVAYTLTRLFNGHNVGLGGNVPPYAKNNLGKGKHMEDTEIKQMFEEAETRITNTILGKIGDKKATKSLTDELTAMEKRLLAVIDTKVAEATPPPAPTELETTFNEVQLKVKQMDEKITSLRAIENRLKATGENYGALTKRIADLEAERTTLAKSITTSVEKVVRGHMVKVNDRLSAIENAPDFHSPAGGQSKGIALAGHGFGHGFGGMLDAAIGEDQ